MDFRENIKVDNGNFSWKQFKGFLKELRRTNKRVRFYSIEDNSIGMPAREIKIQRFRVAEFKMELWENNATYHIEIWNSLNKIDIEIPANASLVSTKYSFGYEWQDGPTHRVMFYTTCQKGTDLWRAISG